MSRHKLVSADAAVALVRDADTLAFAGFGSNGVPEALAAALARRHESEGAPRGLTLLFGGGPGDGGERGMNLLARPGLLARAIGGHWGLVPRIGELAASGAIEAYNFPLGVISHLWRDIARGLPGTVTHVGLGTFADPRREGCRINARTIEPLVEVVTLDGRELLFYRAPRPTVAFLRGSVADPEGNVSMAHETLTQDMRAIATATRNSGGMVIVQVERIAERGSLNPRQVQIPGILVDCVVVAEPQHHPQTFGTPYSPALSSELRVPLDALAPMALDERKLIARRAALELLPNAVVNLGIGMPEGVAAVANEERILSHVTLTAESGTIGGVPQSGLDFGAAINADALVEMNQQFDFYDGGGLDVAFLGLAQCDGQGNVNVSRFGPKVAGAGGFIDITQNARHLVYMGTFTAGGLQVALADGRVTIAREGRARKFVRDVEQVTFSGPHAAARGQRVLFVTERCVFELGAPGLVLTEVAPGIDVERDILGQMDFAPQVRVPRMMDARLYRPIAMGLREDLLGTPLEDRIEYDAVRDTLFLNFEGLRVTRREQVDDIRAVVEARCREIGHPVDAVVNYDAFHLDEAVADEYARMARAVSERWYRRVTRFTSNAFQHLKIGEALARRGLAATVGDAPT
jgi:propionate CoA-transferase